MDVFLPSKQLHSRVSCLQRVWAASVEAVLQCEQEAGSSKDPYVVAVQKDGLTVGHVPFTIFCICFVFVWQGGLIVCTIRPMVKRGNLEFRLEFWKYNLELEWGFLPMYVYMA